MAVNTAPVYAGLPTYVDIGYQTEQYARTRTFDVSAMLAEMPGAAVSLAVRRPKETEAYFADTELSGTTLTWTVSPADTAVPGKGSCQVMLTDESDPARVLLSQVIPVTVNASIVEGGEEDAPDAVTSWLTQAGAMLAQVAASPRIIENFVLPQSGWGASTSCTQYIAIPGLTANTLVVAAPYSGYSATEWAYCEIRSVDPPTFNGTVGFYAESRPEDDIYLKLLLFPGVTSEEWGS